MKRLHTRTYNSFCRVLDLLSGTYLSSTGWIWKKKNVYMPSQCAAHTNKSTAARTSRAHKNNIGIEPRVFRLILKRCSRVCSFSIYIVFYNTQKWPKNIRHLTMSLSRARVSFNSSFFWWSGALYTLFTAPVLPPLTKWFISNFYFIFSVPSK